ncbi:hypothetical protein [Streptomyces sp. 049-1]|uniref:hypothetical protein n=1 Tax=Streptomyces sp. 049-1 TaxID=2789264 RepID=UPI0039813237
MPEGVAPADDQVGAPGVVPDRGGRQCGDGAGAGEGEAPAAVRAGAYGDEVRAAVRQEHQRAVGAVHRGGVPGARQGGHDAVGARPVVARTGDGQDGGAGGVRGGHQGHRVRGPSVRAGERGWRDGGPGQVRVARRVGPVQAARRGGGLRGQYGPQRAVGGLGERERREGAGRGRLLGRERGLGAPAQAVRRVAGAGQDLQVVGAVAALEDAYVVVAPPGGEVQAAAPLAGGRRALGGPGAFGVGVVPQHPQTVVLVAEHELQVAALAVAALGEADTAARRGRGCAGEGGGRGSCHGASSSRPAVGIWWRGRLAG